MEIFIIQLSYRSSYLVVIDNGVVYVNLCENCKIDQPIISYQPK